LTKNQIHRLGERLRRGQISEDDLRLLDTYRRAFADVYEMVIETIRQHLALEPTGRPAKSTTSVIEKLRRESIRLTQMQDIAGCRLIVADIEAQDRLVEQLARLFPETTTTDRRQTLQHLWAELSEKLSDVIDPAIKYGGGTNETRTLLAATSELVGHTETLNALLRKMLSAHAGDVVPDSLAAAVSGLREVQRLLAKALTDDIASLGRLTGGPSALPD
jgi:hypothetical protein